MKDKRKQYYVKTLQELIDSHKEWDGISDSIGLYVESPMNKNHYGIILIALRNLAISIGETLTKDSETWTEWWFWENVGASKRISTAYIGNKKYKILTSSKLYDFIKEWLNRSDSTGLK